MSKKQRIFWGLMAGLFLVTALGGSVLIFWQGTHQSNSNNSSQTTNTTKGTSVDKLAGTKLQNFTPIAHIDSLQKIDTKTGNGAEAAANSTVSVAYTGAVAATGIIFQSSSDNGGQPFTTKLNDSSNPLIQGWEQGIPGMKVGGTRRLLIPASLAYGANPPAGSGIPPNADLVFDVTLLSIQ